MFFADLCYFSQHTRFLMGRKRIKLNLQGVKIELPRATSSIFPHVAIQCLLLLRDFSNATTASLKVGSENGRACKTVQEIEAKDE